MWDRVLKSLPDYSTSILTGLDAEGYPLSLRCTPQIDTARRALRLDLPDYVALVPGPAGLLSHYHDEQLWNLRNFVLRGKLERTDEGWLFYPTQVIDGADGRLTNTLRVIREGRRVAKQYLAKRQLTRPRVPWDKLKAIYVRAQTKP